MKLTIALLSIGAFCLSTVEAITLNHNYWKPQWTLPCEDQDDDCWGKVGDQCQEDDQTCQALAYGVPWEELPCENGEYDCWGKLWSDLNKYMNSRSIHKANQENH